MKKYLKKVLVIVFLVMMFIPFVKADETTDEGNPRMITQLKTSENGVYSYNIGLNFEDWLIPAQSEDETPYCLIEGWELYEKVDGEYKKIYSTDTSDPNFEELYSIEVKAGESRTFAVRVITQTGSYSEYSSDTVLDHRTLTKVVTKIANGTGCFNIIGEGINDKICGTKNEGRKTYQVPVETEIKVKAIPDEGFDFDGWYIFDVESDKISVVVQSTDLEYSFIAYEEEEEYVTTIAPAFIEKTKTSYEVIKGAEQKVANDEEAEFEIDADYSLFKEGGKVYIDDDSNPLNPSNYNSRSGSTVITLLKEYVNTLVEGEHTLKVVFNDESTVTTSFIVIKEESDATNSAMDTSENKESELPTEENTKTEENNKNEITPAPMGVENPNTDDDILFYILTLILSIVVLSGTIFVAKKRIN